VIKLKWREIAPFLSRVLNDDAKAIEREVKTGIAEAWRIDRCYFVTRVEEKELVIVVAQGRDFTEGIKRFLNIARDGDLKSIRFHTKRKGLQKLVNKILEKENAKAELLEKVYRVTL